MNQITPQNRLSQTNSISSSDNSGLEDIQALITQIERAPLPDGLKAECTKLVNRLKRMSSQGTYSADFDIISKYIDWVVQIPWGAYTTDNLDLNNAKQKLDQHHYGLETIKQKVLEYLAVMKLHQESTSPGQSMAKSNQVSAVNPDQDNSFNHMADMDDGDTHAPILCFVGLQGLGKTTIAKSIAQALGRKFIRISLGAMGNVLQLRGESRIKPEAEPGYIVKALVRTGTMNPVILLDEIDKTSGKEGLRSDIMASLLEILDPEQNKTFVDHYIEYPVDLSQVFFIATANTLGTLSTALLDRLEVIRFTSYSDEEKVVIAQNYIMPKVIETNGLNPQQLTIAEDTWPLIVRPLGYDAGIRQLERNLTNLARKVALRIVTGQTDHVHIDQSNVKEFLPEDMGVLG